MILYLHGFRSSPLSFKAQLLAQRLQELQQLQRQQTLAQHAALDGSIYSCPQLPASPRAAIDLASRLIEHALADHRSPADVTVIGSSLGGYYATWLAEHYGCRAVLLNPAVKPPRDLAKYVGWHVAYHSQQRFEFKREYIAELQSLAIAPTQMERYFLIAATGDEVLDWREMVAHYAGARQRIVEGSDHGLSDFADYVDEVLAFCKIL